MMGLLMVGLWAAMIFFLYLYCAPLREERAKEKTAILLAWQQAESHVSGFNIGDKVKYLGKTFYFDGYSEGEWGEFTWPPKASLKHWDTGYLEGVVVPLRRMSLIKGR